MNMSKQIRLKRCPFCGGKARVRENLNGFIPECVDCGANTGPRLDFPAAKIAWNNRCTIVCPDRGKNVTYR
jgi:hypothetical protein